MFTKIEFIVFLVGLGALLFVLKNNTIKKTSLLIANFYFYAYYDYRFLLLLILCVLLTYFIGNLIEKYSSISSRRFCLFLAIALNICVLVYFKYLNFFIETLRNILTSMNLPLNSVDVILPLGISFYIFRLISYSVDIYQKKITTPSLLDFMIYGTFFPIIISGPISRAKTILRQVNNIELSSVNVYKGYRLFVIGIFLKLVVADRIASYVNFFYNNHEVFNSLTAWIAVCAYSIQIYFDFAGYSNMAIGVALIIGIQIEENFDFPYTAQSIIDFWKRWHITLSKWITEYIYIPLGGNRRGDKRKLINLLITMTLCGLWHGASWTFVAWGFFHGLLLIVNHSWKGSTYQSMLMNFPSLYSCVSWSLTVLSVTICWVFFRSNNFCQAVQIIQQLFAFSNGGVGWYHPFVLFILCATILIHILYFLNLKFFTLPIESKTTPAILFCLLWIVLIYYSKEFQPFVYREF